MTKYGFENIAVVGDVIKAFDFLPMKDRDDMFMFGKVIAKGEVRNPHNGIYMFDGYTIEILGTDKNTRDRIGDIGYVPYCTMLDFADRITLKMTAADYEAFVNHLEAEEV